MQSLLHNHSLLWIAPVMDASGFADEARNFVLGIEDAGIPVHLKPIPWDVPDTELDAETRSRLESLTQRGVSPDFICVNQFFPTQVPLAESAAVNICRTMFETDRIPAEWVEPCNEYNFVWVPSEFHVAAFARSGVDKSKLRILPEAIDAELYRQQSESLWPRGNSGFTFLSTFVWQPRKAWDILLEAYCREFESDEKVTLILKVFPDHGLSPEAIEAEAWGFIQDRLGLSRKEAPKIRFVHDSIPVSDMPRLYHSADCFVLPTRGEGWGRPLMEAMACGLPVVAPIFGGQSAFMNSDNAYIIDHTVVPVSPEVAEQYPKFAGHNWAEPSLSHLRQLMRQVYSQPSQARETGARAREHILSNFGRDRVGDWIRSII